MVPAACPEVLVGEAADHARLVGPDWACTRIDRGSVQRAQSAGLDASAVLAPAQGAAAVGRCHESALPVAALTAALRPHSQLACGCVTAGGGVVTRLSHLHHAIAARRAHLVRVGVRVRVRVEGLGLGLGWSG